MHEMGYSFIGPNSFYRLTMDEIRRLQRGFIGLHKRGEGQKARESDETKLSEFNEKLAKLRGN